jgi:PAS domain S-box-containing protein
MENHLTEGDPSDRQAAISLNKPVASDGPSGDRPTLIEQLRAAQAALRASEEFNRRLLESSADCIKVLDLNARLEFMSERGMCIMEVEDFSTAQGAFWPDFWDVEERAHALAAVEEAKSGGTGRFQGFARTMKGSPRWWDVSVLPINGADGRPEKLLSVSRDITVEKNAESALGTSEARLSAIFAQASAGLALTDLNGRFVEVNDRYCEMLGRSREELLSMRMQDLTHPDDVGGNMSLFSAAVASGSSFILEKRYLRPDGTELWVRNSVGAVRDSAGTVSGILAVSVDITDRKAAEARLHELNETLEQQVAVRAAERDRLWTLSQDMLARADYNGMMSAVSPAWTMVLGWGEAELLSRPYATLIHPDDLQPTLDEVRRMGETRRPARFANRVATKDGGWKHIEWTVAPEPDSLNFIAVGRDLSEVKAREAELEAVQETLRQSQKMEAMGSLTGGVAHDFNNLLTPIIGSLDMLMRRNVGSERERLLIDGALQSAERAKTLVQRLLAFARRQPLQPSAVDVPSLVHGMVGLISSTLGPTTEVRFEIAEGLPPAKADLNQLEMALLNLAVNARDAMPQGGELKITAHQTKVSRQSRAQLEPGDYVLLCVSDTGIGMDEATRKRAIEPFFSTKGVGRGTGLGLSMVHGLAAQLGGCLNIESTLGAGTTVELWLPVSAQSSGNENDNGEASTAPLGRGTALLVDDEDLVRMSTAHMLSDLGFEVVETSSAEEALELIKAGAAPDVLVTDHLMPGMSGAELASEARAVHPALPVLIVSGYAEVESIAPELPRLSKPFRNAELAASLSALIPAT